MAVRSRKIHESTRLPAHLGTVGSAETQEMPQVGDLTRRLGDRNSSFFLREEKERQARSRKTGDKRQRGDVTTPGTTAKKPEDSQKPPCHGQVYHGKCNRDGCGYDHNAGRCAAFKAANPDRPPARV